VFSVNTESKETKRLVFKIKRCLHCHVGERADQHKKVQVSLVYVYAFQLAFLESVVKNCPVRDIDKALRVICDFYMSRINEAQIAKSRDEGQGEHVKGGDEVEEEVKLERRLERSDSILPIRNIQLVAALLALAHTAFLHN